MSTLKIALILFIAVMLLVPAQGARTNQQSITSLNITFKNTDAEFVVNYDLGTIPKLYILLMGGTNIVPRINETFYNFNYTIIKIDEKQTLLHVSNISRLDPQKQQYYLHDSTKFGTRIALLNIYMPGSKDPMVYRDINATANTFYPVAHDSLKYK
jgi:hypothetical protein